MHERMIVAQLLLALGTALPNAAEAADTSAALVLEKEIPLADVAGRIDHMAIDLERRHLAVAELGNNTVDLIDLNSGQAIHRLEDISEPQGIAFVPSSDLFAVASGGDGSVRFFHAADLSPAGEIDLGDDADNVRVDGKTGHIVVGYGEGALAVIDPLTRSKLADIALPAHPEGFQLARDGNRAFVNVPDARQVAAVDLASGKQVATWKTADLHSNFPMAIEQSGGTLAIAFRGPPRLALLDAQTGTINASAETCGDSDDVFFDNRRQRIYVSCGEGAVDVFEHKDGALRHVTQVKTYSGARTALFVPELDWLFVASRSGLQGDDAKLLVFRPSP
jgi:hypothetical protein